jgi:polyhydroxyalkanoate synthesis regulator phasin
MDRKLSRKLVVGVVAGLAVAGAGAAIGATQLGSPKEESQAVVNDAAKQLGIEPGKLSAALKKALQNRVDEAVAAGRLTKEQGADLKARIESSDFPLFAGPGFRGGPHGGHHKGIFADLGVAAKYLGLTDAELRTELEGGKSLADVAKAKNKSVDGLVDSLLAAAKTRLDQAVENGRLTKDEETEMLNGLKERITDFVNGRFPAPPHGDRAFGDRFRGPGMHGARPFFGERFDGNRPGVFRGGPPNMFPAA